MKSSKAFLRLLPGALALTLLRRDLEGQNLRLFAEQASECPTLDQLITLIGSLPDQRVGMTRPIRLTASELLLQGNNLSINLKTVGDGCQAQIRVRQPGQTNSATAECTIEFNGNCEPNLFHTGNQLASFVAKASAAGEALTAEAVLLWMREFNAEPSPAKEKASKKAPTPELVLVPTPA